MQRRITRCSAIALLSVGLVFLFNACKKESVTSNNNNTLDVPDILFYALSDNNNLYAYDADNTATPLSTVPITGLLSGEKVLSIDFRPATGQLYALSSTSVLYMVDHTSGIASIVSKTQMDPLIDGMKADIDFNPTVDRLRIVTNTGQNLRVNPETGVVAAEDGDINGVGGASVVGVAYTNNFAGASETVLFDIDAETDKLYKQMPPNDGTLVEVGALGVDVDDMTAFDIAEKDDIALATFTVDGKSGLYGIDLSSGAATSFGEFSSSVPIISIAIPTRPVAYAADDNNNLVIFNPMMPATVIDKAITGLDASEKIVGLDMRPATGQLYGLSNTGKLYTFNLATGAAAMVGTGSLMLEGTSFGFDFNPTVDRIRIVSDAGMNVRVNPNDGTLGAEDLDLNPGTPKVTAAAYANNLPTATTTTLFDIDSETDKLYKQMPPNDGTLVEVGSLGIDVTAANGFDIGAIGGSAWALVTVGTTTSVYTIDVETGAATKVADFPKAVHAMAVGLGL